jgi:hypothetical protein
VIRSVIVSMVYRYSSGIGRENARPPDLLRDVARLRVHRGVAAAYSDVVCTFPLIGVQGLSRLFKFLIGGIRFSVPAFKKRSKIVDRVER